MRAALIEAARALDALGFMPSKSGNLSCRTAGGCLITDLWEGIELFLASDEEVLVARDGQDVAEHVRALTPERARAIGEAARVRILAEHTYEKRGAELDALLRRVAAGKREGVAA